MDLINADAEINAHLLHTMSHSGIQWAVIVRFHSTIVEATAYAYGNTIVFPVTGDDEHIFLLAMTAGQYAQNQCDRYASGVWGVKLADDFEAAKANIAEMTEYIGGRLIAEYDRKRAEEAS